MVKKYMTHSDLKPLKSLQIGNTYLLSLACLAAILRIDPLSLTTTFRTHGLDLLDHTWT